MQNIVIATKNNLDTGASWYGDGDVAWPLTNLANPVYAKVWRFTPGANADGNVARFAMSMGLIRTNHLALPAHNLSEGGQIRLRAGTARFDADFTTDSPFTHDITAGGGANGTRFNEYGVMVAATCPRYNHDRRSFDNGFRYSEDLSQADWVEESGARKYPDGRTVEFAQAGAKLNQQGLELYDDSYEQRWQVRLVSGDGAFCCQVNNGAADVDGPTQTATTDWQWVRSDIATGAATSAGKAGIKKLSAAGVLQLRKAQIRRGVFQVGHQDRDRYRKTTNQRRYQRIGLLGEPAATNALLQSHTYANASWSKGANVTVTTTFGPAPDGTSTISSINCTVAGQSVSQVVSGIGGTTTRAHSFTFLKGSSSGDATIAVNWFTGGVTQSVGCQFNPGTGAFIASSASGATLKAAGVEGLGGGFFRAYVIGTGTDAANTQLNLQLKWNAIGTIFAWGSQNEPNVVTSYVPTTTLAVTRSADTAVVETGTWVPYVLNAQEGTLYHEWQPPNIPPGSTITVADCMIYSNATPTNNVYSDANYNAGSGYKSFAFVNNGGAWIPAGVATGNGVARSALRYRSGDFAHYVNGTLDGTSAAAVPAGLDRIDLLRNLAAPIHLRKVTLWPTGKSSADLQALSTSGPGAIDSDSGWDDVLQAPMGGDVPAAWGTSYDIIKTFPMRAVEWMRVELYDPDKTSSGTPFEIGRAFVGKFVFQPAKNAQYGMQYSWRERTTSDEAIDGRKFFNERPRVRELVFTFPRLTPTEADRVHEIHGSGGTSQEVLVLTDPDDEANCQRFGFVGYLSKLDPIKYPLVNVREVGFELEKKR